MLMPVAPLHHNFAKVDDKSLTCLRFDMSMPMVSLHHNFVWQRLRTDHLQVEGLTFNASGVITY